MYHRITPFILTALFSTALFAGEDYYPVLADAPWSTIHQNTSGSKEGEYKTLRTAKYKDEFKGSVPILMTLGHHYLYVQSVGDTKVCKFDPYHVSKGALGCFDLGAGATYPKAGGGALDHMGNTWWTTGTRLVRLNAELTEAVYSDALVTEAINLNSVDFLPDGRILVGSMTPSMFIVDPIRNGRSTFAKVKTIQKGDFDYKGIHIGSEETFGPRPVQDSEGNYYINTSHKLLKLNKNLDRQALWIFENPENITEVVSDMALSNPVIVQGLVCVTTQPKKKLKKVGNRVEPVFQLVYCLDRQTGLERFATLKPFSEPGTSALHTLGAIEKENKLFVIGQSGKGGAGIAAFDLAVGKRLWVNPLNHVSGSLVLSAPSQRLYIMKKDSLLASTMEFMALDTSSSKGVVINSIASKSIPLPSLGAVGPGGVYFPTPSGFIRYSE